MRVLVLWMVIFSLTSCGLFKKSEKVTEKSELSEKVSEKSESVSEYSEKQVDKSISRMEAKNVVSDKKDVDSRTGITADQIVIDSNGNITATGNANYLGYLRDKSTLDAIATITSEHLTDVVLDSKAFEQSNADYNADYLEKASTKKVVSVPSVRGILLLCVVLLIGLAACWWGLRRVE